MSAKERLHEASEKLFLGFLDGAVYQAVKIYEEHNPDKVRTMSYGGKDFTFSDSGQDLKLEDQFRWAGGLMKGDSDPEYKRLVEAYKLENLRVIIEFVEFVFGKK